MPYTDNILPMKYSNQVHSAVEPVEEEKNVRKFGSFTVVLFVSESSNDPAMVTNPSSSVGCAFMGAVEFNIAASNWKEPELSSSDVHNDDDIVRVADEKQP
ncbi:hypothetical protein AB6A40_010570 [Gnathostoma spinigerum]|uniref:Uncharacterized protein n=1 Tax=Gnathostoma spinigerum TaxID=75299 RepID=A0ABD6F1E2_9BILA